MMLLDKPTETILTAAPATTPAAPKPALAGSPLLAPALATGAMLWACHFPLAWGWLGWVALVPFLTLARASAAPRRIYFAAYLAGIAFFVPVLQFMRVADPRMYATWLMLACYCAAYFPVALWLIRMLDRRTTLPFCLSVPLVWVGLEWIRSFLLTGFAWYYLGHAQHQFSSLIQIADFGGVYAISFVVAAVNGWLCDVAFHIPALRDRFRWREDAVRHVSHAARSTTGLWLQGGAVAMALVASVLYGSWRLEQTAFLRGPRVALVQTNIPQSVRDGKEISNQMFIQNQAIPFLACTQEPLPDLFVWPETSYIIRLSPTETWQHYIDLDPKLPIENVNPGALALATEMRTDFRDKLTAAFPTKHLLGINTIAFAESGQPTRHSSALLVQDDGTPTHRFDKIHRVPFGEYVPFIDWLPFMKVFAPYGGEGDTGIAPGKTMTRFPLRDFHFGTLVCFEDTDPYLARQYAQTNADGKPVDFLVNMSNDGWFHGTSEHEEHLVVSRFRAIENRRSLVRAANMGVSAIIDPNGRILKPQAIAPDRPDIDHPSLNPKLARAQKLWDSWGLWNGIKLLEKERPNETIKVWETLPNRNGDFDELAPAEYAQFKGTAGVLMAIVPIDRRVSVYSQWGDWLPIACWGIVLGAISWSVLRSRRPAAAATA